MKPLYVINDIHAGAIRSGGTTPTTAWELRQAILKSYEGLLNICDSDLLINGDWLDGYSIPQADLLEVFHSTSRWLAQGHHLYAARGNHDASKNSQQMSSFDFLVKLLHSLYPDQVSPLFEPALIRPDVYVVPHIVNSDLFELELAKVPAVKYVMVHCNYDNKFAQEADHSLDLSREWAEKLPVDHIVFGHVHQQSTALGGKVVIVGNQICTSIADCLGNTSKRMLKITDAGMEFIQTWTAEGSFSQQDWRELTDTGDFIRVTGTATPDEAAKVVTALGRFRRDAKALVITNAVKIGENDTSAEMVLTHEEVTSFNVMGALREFLGPDDAAEVDQIMKEHNAQ